MKFKRFAIVVGLCLVLSACSRAEREHGDTPDPASQRLTSSGPVVGFVGSYGSQVWLGIPGIRRLTRTFALSSDGCRLRQGRQVLSLA